MLSCSSSAVQAPRRFLARGSRARRLPILAVKVGRSAQARPPAPRLGLARRRCAGPEAALRARRHPVRDLQRCSAGAGLRAARRFGRLVGRGTASSRSRPARLLVADLAPRWDWLAPIPADARASARSADLSHIQEQIDPWGRRRPRPTARPSRPRDRAADVVALVTTSRWLRGDGSTCPGAGAGCLPSRIAASCRHSSRWSPACAQVEAQLDAAGGVPILRGSRTAAPSRGGRWEGRHAARPRRDRWPVAGYRAYTPPTAPSRSTLPPPPAVPWAGPRHRAQSLELLAPKASRSSSRSPSRADRHDDAG
jgi:hypothetical protein